MRLDYGQPLGGISQFAYVVADIDRSMREFTAQLGVGPWFLRDHFTPLAGRYRGQPTRPTFSLARGFTGHSMVELIVQHDDGPSIYHEGDGPRRYGFHHWAVVTDDFDGTIARYQAQGYEEAFYDELPSGARVMYVDATRDLPGMIEVVELNAAQERVYTDVYLAAVGWDGTEPVRGY
jgi:hypothetical protein